MSHWHMPFGKHKGQPLSAVPTDYLWWVVENCIKLGPWLREAILQEIVRRGDDSARTAGGPTWEQVRQVYRELALEYHPDRGGSVDAMKAINAFHDRLRAASGN